VGVYDRCDADELRRVGCLKSLTGRALVHHVFREKAVTLISLIGLERQVKLTKSRDNAVKLRYAVCVCVCVCVHSGPVVVNGRAVSMGGPCVCVCVCVCASSHHPSRLLSIHSPSWPLHLDNMLA
jgi:hypothetical protein